jgi:hypothetical protein
MSWPELNGGASNPLAQTAKPSAVRSQRAVVPSAARTLHHPRKVTRLEQGACKARALECERAAQESLATDLALSNLFLDLAHRWREMAKDVQHD